MDFSEAPPLEQALALRRSAPDFLELTDSRFHQNGFQPPFEVVERAFQEYRAENLYAPDSRGRVKTRTVVAQFYRDLGFDVDKDDVILTAGTSESYRHLFTLFCPPGGTIALPKPGYPLFEHLAKWSGRRFVFYELSFQRGWQIDPVSLEAIAEASLVVLISPNNPTGVCLDAASLERVRTFCDRTGASWISDEVFDIFTADDQELLRPGSYLGEVSGFTLNGISKRFASPDWKLSWIVLSGRSEVRKERGRDLEFTNDAFLSATPFSQLLAAKFFEELDLFQTQMVEAVGLNRKILRDWAASRNDVAGKFDLGGIYVPIRLISLRPDWDDERFVFSALQNESLFVHPGYYYDFPSDEPWIVVSLIKGRAEFEEGLRRLGRSIERASRF